MTDHERNAIQKLQRDGLGYKKIASILGLAVNGVKTYCRRHPVEKNMQTAVCLMFEVQELDTLSEFDEKLWLTVIDTVTAHADGRLTFKFQGSTEIDV